ncbi:MAG TPA: PQQ-binding-like beta-propeller repeat protein [Acidimicrobiia bacterium]
MNDRAGPAIAVVLAGTLLGVLAFFTLGGDEPSPMAASTTTTLSAGTSPGGTDAPDSTSTTGAPATTTTALPERQPDDVPSWTVGRSWGSVSGITMFRGNPTRTFHGAGPVPTDPAVAWTYPASAMCGQSSVGGETTTWCGLGWTGQPVVHEREDGVTEIIFGAYDKAVHFVNAADGTDLRPKFQTGDIIKGSVTLDPDGFPLIYFGSRDNKLRIVALDREQPTELWSLDANEVSGVWNNDWDGNPVIVDDIMYEGGENGWFFAYELNRSYGDDGRVTVEPRRLVAMPGYDDELIARSGRNVSIESSVAVYGQRVYFTNSGGRVVGLDVSDVRNGNAPIVFDYWAGGDIDATPVVDADGYVYVSVEYEPSLGRSANLERNREVGQLIKLDPDAEGDPRVWGVDLTQANADTGIWATPALYQGHLYVPTHHGELLAVDTESGEIVWTDQVAAHTWTSPLVVDHTLIQATCGGEIRAYSLEDPSSPSLLWTAKWADSCLEATPVVWDGSIYIGSRDGFFRALR